MLSVWLRWWWISPPPTLPKRCTWVTCAPPSSGTAWADSLSFWATTFSGESTTSQRGFLSASEPPDQTYKIKPRRNVMESHLSSSGWTMWETGGPSSGCWLLICRTSSRTTWLCPRPSVTSRPFIKCVRYLTMSGFNALWSRLPHLYSWPGVKEAFWRGRCLQKAGVRVCGQTAEQGNGFHQSLEPHLRRLPPR